jgi:hypothetical protein
MSFRTRKFKNKNNQLAMTVIAVDASSTLFAQECKSNGGTQ